MMLQVINIKSSNKETCFVKPAILSITIIFLTIFIQPASSQNYNFEVQTIPLKGEFINFSGSSILQDSDGYMWFGSTEGLYRYQGTGVKVFRHIQDDEHTLLDNFVSDMYEDSEGVMWIGTLNGLNRYDKYTETFSSFTHNREDSTSIIWGQINMITEDKSHRLWIATNGGFSSYDRETGIFKNYQVERQDSSAIEDPYEIFYLYPDDEEYLWLTTGNGVYRFHIPSGTLEKINDIENDFTFEVYKDTSGRYWFFTPRGLFQYDLVSQSYKRFIIESEYQNRPESQVITNMIEDEMGNIWMRTLGGIYCYNQELELMYSLEHPFIYLENARNIHLLKELFIDQTGSIWYYSAEAINQIIPKGSNFRAYDVDIPTGRTITCIYPENKDLIWFGTEEGINSLDRKKNEYRMYFGDLVWKSGNPDAARYMYADRNGTLWIGMYIQGLFSMIRSENGERQLQKHQPEGISSGNLRESGLYGLKYIFEDSSERLWVSGVGFNGQQYYDRMENRLIRLTDNPSAKDKLPVKGVIRHQTGSDTLWSIGSSGIYKIILPLIKISDNRVMPSDVMMCRLYDETGQEIGIPQVNRSYMDRAGNIWLGTRISGLIKASRKKMSGAGAGEYTLKFFSTSEGLPSENIMSILPDGDGNLWMGTYNGLSNFNTLTEIFTNYFVRHGLPANEFWEGSAATGVDGELFFGTIAGMISFYPENVYINEHVAPVMITGIRINNQPLQPGENSKLNTSISYVDNIGLQYNQDNISIEYAILNYNNPEWNQYRYKLEGFNDDWVSAGNRTHVDFTNLKPGKYTFHVSGSNNDGIWNEEGRSLGIIIHRPPWASWYAYLVYIFLAAGVAFWIYRYLSNRSRMRMAVEVERIEKQKLQELDSMRSRFFANVSHEFRTPLTLLLGPVEELREKLPNLSDESRNLLKTMKRNAYRLQTLVNQLLDISKLETGKVKLEVSEGDLTRFIRTIVLSFLSHAESKKITYEYNLPEQRDKLFFDRDKLEKILVNLISNAFKFTPAGGKVIADMKFLHGQDPEIPDMVEISVSDTGKGIPDTELDKIFDRFYQVSDSDTKEQEGTGIGLALTRELVELYRGEISVSSKVDRGSTFTVKLPVLKEAFREEELVEAPEAGKEEPLEKVFVSGDPDENGEPGSLAVDNGTDGPFILIVEDNLDLRNYISRNLVGDYRIQEAGNGREGFEKAVEKIPDLVITDLMMPEMDGMEMCKKLKKDDRTSHIPVIMLTAKADRTSKLKGLETGADDYLIKPFDPEELQVRTKNLIEQRKILRAKFIEEFRLMSLDDSQGVPQDKLLHRVLEILKENISNSEYNVESVADDIHLSRSQMFRKISALTGNGPGDLLRIMRIKKAAELLLHSDQNITQVMYEVGFQTPAYFARKFREYFGVNPSEYRRIQRR